MKKFTLEQIYGSDNAAVQKKRYLAAAESFREIYGISPERFFSAPGRSEVGGNHTDHDHGKVLAAGISLDVIAAAVGTDDGFITIKSEGFPEDKVSIADLTVKESDVNSSAALIRGVADGFIKNGLKIGGFKAYTTSNVLKGSGLSSSAAFEVLVGTILSCLYNGGEVSAVKIAQIAQYAENVHFGKPSGLMDQMASSVGGFITIDFADTDKPVIETIPFDFSKSGYSLCIIDTKGSHADLTPEYAAITAETKAVAEFFGKRFLREITKEQVMGNISELRRKCGDRAVLRALHFFDDNERVVKEAAALSEHRFEDFLALVNDSGNSSYKYLQNIFAVSSPEAQGLAVGLYAAGDILSGRGAARVHGGGFAGTIQAFVPDDMLERFRSGMEDIFGSGSCYVLSVRPIGGAELNIEG